MGSYTENSNLRSGAAQQGGGADGDEDPSKKYWFLNIKRYRRFFNVDTEVSPGCMQQHSPGTSKVAALALFSSSTSLKALNGVQDILIRIRDSVIGSYKADFFDKTTDNADL